MPAQISHLLAGTAALKAALPSDCERILASHGPCFALGCQGPDIFYHNQRTRPLSVLYGSLVHRRGADMLCQAMATAGFGEGPASAWGAYTLGFITHVFLDRACHPFIVYHSGWVMAGRPETASYRSCHPMLERVLDVLAWERSCGLPVSAFRQQRTLCPAWSAMPSFAERLALALRGAYRSRAASDADLRARMANAFTDSCYFYEHTDPSDTSMDGRGSREYAYPFAELSFRSVSLVYPEGFERSVDWANEEHRTWLHPCEPERPSDASYFDLCAAAESDSVPALRVCADALRGSRESLIQLPLAVGSGTLNVGDAAGKQARPLRMDPLPLEALMRAQYEARLSLLGGPLMN